jgi:hypothetical protein
MATGMLPARLYWLIPWARKPTRLKPFWMIYSRRIERIYLNFGNKMNV